MAYFNTSPQVNPQHFADLSATALLPLGTILPGSDPTLGGGEFIYLLGVASTAIGSIVTYNPSTWQTALAPVGTNKPQPVAFAMSACLATQYGWYQIGGIATCKKTSSISMAAGIAVGVKTIGLTATSGTGKEIQGALTAAAGSSTAGSILVSINRPTMQGRVS